MLDGNTSSHIWGLGYRRLCSVVPPGAPLHPESRLSKRAALGPDKDPRGKAPGRRGPDGLWSGYDFTKHDPTFDDVVKWVAWGASLGMKMGQGLVAIDADTPSPEQAAAVARILDDHLPPAPTRIGRVPKFLRLYRIAEDVPYAKVTFTGGHVELITEGKQFVAEGVHPGTGRPYEWPDPLCARDALPLITPEQLQGALDAIAEALGGDKSVSGELGLEVDQASLSAPLALVQQAVNHLPNRDADFPGRDDFNRVGYAIKAAAGAEHEQEALDCFQQWAARWDAGYNDPAEVEEEWARMKPPFRIGADWLFQQAERLGNWTGRAQMFFEPVAAPPQPKRSDVYETLDIDAVLNLEPPEFLIDRHLPQQSLVFVYGRPGCGKSFVVLDMALTISHALASWNGDTIKALPRPVVIYIAREGSAGLKQRIAAWQQANVTPVGIKPLFYVIRAAINFMVPDDIGKLVRTIRALGLERVDLVVVDTVSRAIPGADENKQAYMTLFVAACDAVMDEIGCTVIGVHHAGKSGDMRGSTVLLGAGDAVFRLDREEGAKIGFLRCEKQKDAPDGWSESYRFQEVAGSLVVKRIVTEVSEAEVRDEISDILAAMRKAWDAERPLTNTVQSPRSVLPHICRLLDVSASRAAELLKRIVDEGLAAHEVCKGRIKGYRVLREPEAPEPETPPDIFD